MNERVYEVGTRRQVHAFHVMPGLPPPEGERHGHDYGLDVVVRRETLDDDGMVVDLDRLGRAVQDTADRVAGRDLDAVIGGPGPVTVEVFAQWAHERIGAALGVSAGAVLSVRVWESPTEFGGYTAPVG